MVALLLVLLVVQAIPYQAVLAKDGPLYPFYLPAPWPAGTTLHSGGTGYGYGDGRLERSVSSHINADYYALDINGEEDRLLIGDRTKTEPNDSGIIIMAIADGCVEVAKNNPTKDYGWNIVINHPGGYRSHYAHLVDNLSNSPIQPMDDKDVKINVNAGDWDKCKKFVTQGEPIGYIGGSGVIDNGIHLHFALSYCPLDAPKQICAKTGLNSGADPVKPFIEGNTNAPYSEKPQIQYTSTNYPVGFEEITDPKANIFTLVKFEEMIQGYITLGGQQQIGRTAGPVRTRQLVGSTVYFQPFYANDRSSSYVQNYLVYDPSANLFTPKVFLLSQQEWENYGDVTDRLPVICHLGITNGFRVSELPLISGCANHLGKMVQPQAAA